MFHLPAVPVAQFVADYIERTKDGVVEWIWFGRNRLFCIYIYIYLFIYIHTNPEFVKIDWGNSQKFLIKTNA